MNPPVIMARIAIMKVIACQQYVAICGGGMYRSVSSPQASGGGLPTCGTLVPSRSVTGPSVTILLCTLNGERFLPEQLASLQKQTFKNWRLIASDDGSSDRTKSILHAFQKSFEPGKVEIMDGPRRGAPANFLFLACAENLVSDFYAFCDQDDIWEPDKLARAVDLLKKVGPDIPALYGSRARLIYENDKNIGFHSQVHRG